MKTIYKTLSWRLLATSTTLVLAYLITGSVETAGAIGGAELLVKSVIYYLHEKVWDKSSG